MTENTPQIVSTPAEQTKPLPGEVREELKITFSATLDRMETLIGKVQVLAVQAENYFWSHRSTALRSVLTGENGDADMLDDCVTGAEKLCLAAYPMLNEITERLHYISGVADPYVDIGEDTGEHSWDIANDGADATRTFYMPTVREVCATLNSYVEQMRDWSDNAEGWQDEGTSSIRQMYGAALLEMYARTRQVIDLLGPLFPPVICNYFPRVTAPDGITGNTENFLPTECRFVKKDTQSIEIALYAGAYHVPFSAAIGSGYADWFNTPTVVSNGEKVYPRRGGIISVEQMTLEDSSDDLTGVYEIYECADNLVISNEDLISEAYESQVLDNIYGTTFKMRLIRKAEEDTSGTIHVQYRTDMDNLDTDHFEQEFSWEFDSDGVNEHNTPMAKNTETGFLIWKRYDADTHFGTNYQRDVTITNVTKDTLFVSDILSTLGVNGNVRCIAVDATYLYIGGKFDSVGGENIRNLARITLATGLVDATWTPNPDSLGIFSITIDTAGNIFVGGAFLNIESVASSNLAKFNSAGVYQSAWTPNPNIYVSALGTDSSGNLYVVGGFTSISGATRNGIAKYNSSGSLQSFSPYANGPAYCIKIDGSDNVYIGGNFEILSDATAIRTNLVAYDSSGIILDFQPDPDDIVLAINKDSSGNVYIGGLFTKIYDCETPSVQQNCSYLAKYDATGQFIATWTPTPNAGVNSIEILSTDYVCVGGDFTLISTVSRSYVALYDDSGNNAIQGWTPALDKSVFVVVKDGSDNLFIGGNFTAPYLGCFVYDGTDILPVPGWV